MFQNQKISSNQYLFRASAGLEHGFVNDPELCEGLLTNQGRGQKESFAGKASVSEKVLVSKRFLVVN
ncbi:MAG: hypothetical protein A2W51_03005 [Candidatus Zambryskibacteria bacterium RIFCSPHIGHO2_02_39_10]|nr:MAG: hypothetical protein A2W51_03005 [Candidatus Zambryskibacteria bacterium RIFCSPHIGHO2_02_39_10]